MALGSLEVVRQADIGRWWAATFSGQPAIKLFLSSDFDATSPSDLSLYWRGTGSPAQINQFIMALRNSWGDARVVDNTEDPPRALSARDIGIGSEDFPRGRVFLNIRSSQHEDAILDIWADGKSAPHKLTREVGIALHHQLLREIDVASACIDLLCQTFLGGGSTDHSDMGYLLKVVNDTARSYFGTA